MNLLTRALSAGLGLAAVAAVSATAAAVESLGNEQADKLVSGLQAKDESTQLTCKFVGEIVTCGGAKIGNCMDLNWQVNHDGSTCRKNVNDAQ